MANEDLDTLIKEIKEDSLDTQLALCAEYADRHGHQIAREYVEDTISAAKEPLDSRPAGCRLIADIADRRRVFGGVIVLALDRLFRSPADEFAGIAYLARHRCELVSVREGPLDISTPEGELSHGIGAVIRRHEARRVGQRVREHNLSLALSGQTLR
jgi:site-specific DNA recombinase